ncbi:MAG TPA: helix-turn-helix transcriptional regulator [Candidatus Aquilonibacter sp.]|nr:helix-turn-helix transcriptional regulator [Candidatus Aquilonibacter sp.]
MSQAVSARSRRQNLAAFLRVKRDAMSPQEAGIVVQKSRHVPGLRREEVAEIAGISATWYAWLEQGREINVSSEVLQKVGRALRMTDHEVSYMERLVAAAPLPTPTLVPEIPNVLRALVENHQDAPAYVATPRWDLLVWNAFMGELMGYERDSAPLERNILYRIFFDASRRTLLADWEALARNGAAVLRYNYSYYMGDPHFEALLDALRESDDFVRLWELHEVSPPRLPATVIRHPSMGVLEVETVQASLDMAHGCVLALFDCKKIG